MHWTGVVFTLLAGVPPDGAAQLAKVERLMPALSRLAADPQIVEAVRAQNARGVSLDTVRERDEAWQATSQLTPLKKEVLGSACSKLLVRHQQALGRRLAESFVMDKLGGLVGATRRPSDYWQGDEAKFQVPFTRGVALTEKPFFDDSSLTYVVQVSLPIRDAGRVIGAVTFSLSLLDL
ncbi:PDC sensor domain-containing protein [Myxococcus sp. K15C18031901]|uniref:PDC sensor domain-containing protein n=1 Tax=Myxococcus dinghuensis TaxID=2906761 RepID=UPI0020A80E76|nr:PDC sensor domain-containing protein [Myxococcus dinghuensis]MCP3103926.1 PDC sensor domain-containing protein [Myxococcus dinghuensis]